MSASPQFGAYASPRGAARRALAACDFDSLLAGAARLRGDRAALAASGEGVTLAEAMTFAELDAAATRLAAALADGGLKAGDCALIAGAADPATIVLLFGAARAGLVTALASAGAGASELEACARECRADALLAPAAIGPARPVEALLTVAARVDTVRLVGVWGGDAEGAARLDIGPPDAPALRAAPAPVVTFAQGRDGPVAIRHRQTTLAAAALDFLARAQIGAGLPLVAAAAPTRFAGLIAGPVASLLSGATLRLHAPFSADALVAAIRDCQPAHLILPAALGADMAQRARAERLRLASLVLVGDDGAGTIDADAAIVDIRRVGEIAAPAERRDERGRRAAFPGPAHVVPLAEDELEAIEARPAAGGGWEWKGAAVTGGEDWTRA